MENRGIPPAHKHLNFCQLYGMSDHLSFNLKQAGFNVAKYVPYGEVGEVPGFGQGAGFEVFGDGEEFRCGGGEGVAGSVVAVVLIFAEAYPSFYGEGGAEALGVEWGAKGVLFYFAG